MNRTCIVLVGSPCSGKSSVGKMVAEKFNTGYISSGDIARRMAKYNKNIENNLNMGNLAPEHIMRDSIYSGLLECFEIHCRDIVILDGFPRSGEQANWLRNQLSSTIDIRYVLLYTSLSTIIERSANRNREDDKSLERRLNYYYNVTFKELCNYINITIDADDNTVNDCAMLLMKYIREVTNNVKDR